MAILSLRLPESLHRELTELAKTEGVSLNRLIATAAAEKLSALTQSCSRTATSSSSTDDSRLERSGGARAVERVS